MSKFSEYLRQMIKKVGNLFLLCRAVSEQNVLLFIKLWQMNGFFPTRLCRIWPDILISRLMSAMNFPVVLYSSTG